MVYQWKSASRIKADANDAGKMFEMLESSIGLSPKTLLDANRDDDAPLHNEFEWDDEIAAESYRLSQAGYLIRMLCIKSDDADKKKSTPIRAFFKTSADDGFERIDVIIRDSSKRSVLLQKAKYELDSYLTKYNQLEELNPIRSIADKIFSEVSDS